jgi:hypothetical protein
MAHILHHHIVIAKHALQNIPALSIILISYRMRSALVQLTLNPMNLILIATTDTFNKIEMPVCQHLITLLPT